MNLAADQRSTDTHNAGVGGIHFEGQFTCDAQALAALNPLAVSHPEPDTQSRTAGSITLEGHSCTDTQLLAALNYATQRVNQ